MVGTDHKRYIGTTDVALDFVGHGQADYWRQIFASIPLRSVYSSNLSRCVRTADGITSDQSVTGSAELNEINMGAWDGLLFDDVRSRYPEGFRQRGECMDIFRPPGGESFYDLSLRVLPFFHACIKQKRFPILMVTHAGVIRVILTHILGRPLKDLFQIRPGFGELFVLQTS